MKTPRDFALSLISRNPQITNNPNAQQLLQVVQENNSAKGAQIAQNICDSYGITREQAIQEAKRFFGLP